FKQFPEDRLACVDAVDHLGRSVAAGAATAIAGLLRAAVAAATTALWGVAACLRFIKASVRPRVDQPRHDRLAGSVDHFGAGWYDDIAADGFDFAALDDERAILDDLATNGEDARVGERYGACTRGRMRRRGILVGGMLGGCVRAQQCGRNRESQESVVIAHAHRTSPSR